ncbi:ElaA protein [Filimonas lacunae]|uniref:ElaA protein n=1 Tax=Filimonas lacunae TaxID=477680 RepID=A0A173MMR3_9BACT|nr:GNAT family N-acetyltransferase [Filimonas lacunae]BAV08776.1 ElaA protein [Filimonas lacunae]SIS61559.1 ElaA protein [Filimonas lacunae]
MNFSAVCKHFTELTLQELYALLRLRSEVFVVEQNCVFLDMDNKDQECHHLLLWDGNNLVACARLVPPGISYTEMSIGRIVSSPAYRGTGSGQQLVAAAIELCYELFGKANIQIGAQLYLEKFYGSFGFERIGEVYDEDGIDHIHMLKHT